MTPPRFQKGIYRAILNLHPADFQERFSEEMLWIFDQTVEKVGTWRLVVDGLSSLLKQWMTVSPVPRPVTSPIPVTPSGSMRFDGIVPSLGSWTAWGVPLVVGLLLSTTTVALLVPPRPNSLSWTTLLGHSAGLLFMAAVLALVGVWVMHRLFVEHLGSRPVTAVLACAWSAAIWLPLLLLLRSEHALWVIAAPLPVAVIVTRFTRRQFEDAGKFTVEAAAAQPVLFASVSALRPRRVAWMALFAAVLLQALIAATAAQVYTLAESLAILLAAVLVWASSGGGLTETSLASVKRRRRGSIVPCFLLTSLALTPFLRSALQSVGFRQVVLAGVAPTAFRKVVPGMAYTGFILTTPPLPKRARIDPPRKPSMSPTGINKEQIIPFDGVYWFYEADVDRPGRDAPVRRGDPLTSTIRSTSFVPLKMEAHQRLGSHIEAGCCNGFAVDVRDADNRIGSITVEAILRDASAPSHPSHSLGSATIRASLEQKLSIYRPPVNERLHFQLRGVPRDFRFNEVTLIIRPARGRDLAGARVKIRDFALEP